jgi:hypothetical protein
MSSPTMTRWSGLAALLGGVLGIVLFPFHALAWFATPDGAQALNTPWVAAWTAAVKPILAPLLTFALPDTVYQTYGRITVLVTLGFLAGLVGLHTFQARRSGRLEKAGFWIALVGTILLTLGVIGEYWVGALEFSFVAFSLPGLLVLMIGSFIFGIGTLRAGVAPHLGAWLLTLGSFPGMIAMNVLTGHLSGALLLLDLAWIIIGYALWARSNAAVQQQPTEA